MTHVRRIKEIVDGRLELVELTQPLVSSARTPWSGPTLERSIVGFGNVKSIKFPYDEVIMVAKGTINLAYRAFGTNRRFVAGPGSITIWPAGYESTLTSWTSQQIGEDNTEVVRIQLDMSVISSFLPEGYFPTNLWLTHQPGIQDPALASLIRLMELDVSAECPTGKLYGESLTLALMTYLVGRHYSTKPVVKMPLRYGCSQPVFKRVIDYMHANLGHDLSITHLAAVANMSPHHFAQRFKSSIGISPHQYLMRARVIESKHLLRTQGMTVVEVAHALGFASQSHFTYVFRRLNGTTPKRYQRLI